VSSENSAKAPTENYSFDEKKSLFTDDDVQRLAMAVKNLMLDDLRKELRQDELSPCISNKSMCKSESKFNFFLSGLWSGVSILLGESSEECLLRFCFVIFASILDIFQSCHSVDLVCYLMKKNLCSPTMMYSDLQWPLKI
jgi:hypothetical protein